MGAGGEGLGAVQSQGPSGLLLVLGRKHAKATSKMGPHLRRCSLSSALRLLPQAASAPPGTPGCLRKQWGQAAQGHGLWRQQQELLLWEASPGLQIPARQTWGAAWLVPHTLGRVAAPSGRSGAVAPKFCLETAARWRHCCIWQGIRGRLAGPPGAPCLGSQKGGEQLPPCRKGAGAPSDQQRAPPCRQPGWGWAPSPFGHSCQRRLDSVGLSFGHPPPTPNSLCGSCQQGWWWCWLPSATLLGQLCLEGAPLPPPPPAPGLSEVPWGVWEVEQIFSRKKLKPRVKYIPSVRIFSQLLRGHSESRVRGERYTNWMNELAKSFWLLLRDKDGRWVRKACCGCPFCLLAAKRPWPSIWDASPRPATA